MNGTPADQWDVPNRMQDCRFAALDNLRLGHLQSISNSLIISGGIRVSLTADGPSRELILVSYLVCRDIPNNGLWIDGADQIKIETGQLLTNRRHETLGSTGRRAWCVTLSTRSPGTQPGSKAGCELGEDEEDEEWSKIKAHLDFLIEGFGPALGLSL